MGNLRVQMDGLAQGIATSAHERMMAVGDSQAQTASMLLAFGRERTAMAKALKSGLAADRVGRSINLYALRADAGVLCERLRRDHVHMRRSLRRKLGQSSEAVATFVAALRADFAKGRANFAKAHRHMAKAQRTGLAKDRRERALDVVELINNFRASRGEMAHELAESLAKSTQNVRFRVAGLKKELRASLQKTREDASVSRQIPSYLLAAQRGGATRVPSSARPRAPEERKKKRRVGTKTSVTKTVSAFVRKPAKQKKKATVANAVRAFVGKRQKPKRK